MATLEQSVKKIRAFDFEKELLNIVSLNDQKALNLNRDTQLFIEGSDSLGNQLDPPYTDLTIFLKRLAGQPANRVTLRDSGAFHDSFFLDPSKFPVRIDATDSKTDDLKGKYGKDIFGLDDESQGDFNKHILSDVQTSLKKGIGI